MGADYIMAGEKKLHDHGEDFLESLKNLPDTTHFLNASEIFRQLSDATRLRILWLLCHSEECVNNIACALEMSDSAVSHHLRSLKHANLLSSRRDGKEMRYTLANNEQALFAHKIIDTYFNDISST